VCVNRQKRLKGISLISQVFYAQKSGAERGRQQLATGARALISNLENEIKTTNPRA
jgi:hypothetical protein